MNVIIFINSIGTVSIVYPTAEALQKFSILEIAKKSVPTGKPFKIVDVSIIPTDETLRDAWVIEESLLTDGVGE